jgi:hypothetical protein
MTTVEEEKGKRKRKREKEKNERKRKKPPHTPHNDNGKPDPKKKNNTPLGAVFFFCFLGPVPPFW